MRTTLLLLTLLALATESTLAARWEKATVPVYDFTLEAFRPDVQATVDDFNAAMPPGVPRLTYVPMLETPCDSLPAYGTRGRISVCTWDRDYALGDTFSESRHGIMTNALVHLYAALFPELHRNTICHEFMHALTAVPDSGYPRPHPDTSCIQGNLDHLGSWDIAYAAKVYGTKHRHQSKHRH